MQLKTMAPARTKPAGIARVLKRLIAKAKSHYPDSRILLAGWDFYLTWHPEEVSGLLKDTI